jgi:ABC-type multidrug transport system ATPase subunit
MEINSTIEVDNINLSYGKISALKNISFSVNSGEIFGLIGPDGAGKTSLFRILSTLLLADSGIATIDGFDVVKDYKKIRKNIGYMPGKFSLYQDLTVEENLAFFATVFNTTISENYDLIEDIYKQIEPFKNRRAGKLSGGMKQKLALCCALIHKPLILFLDEPTTGVDPVSRKEFWEILKHLKSLGITILVSTPYMDEASLCNRIALIQQGKILKIDSPKNISESYPRKLYAVESDGNYKQLQELRKNTNVRFAYSFGDSIHLTLIDNAKLPINNFNLKEINPTIEDCFIEMTGNK